MPPWGHSKFCRLNEDDCRKLRYILENGIFQHNCYYVEFIIRTFSIFYNQLLSYLTDKTLVACVASDKMRGPRSLGLCRGGTCSNVFLEQAARKKARVCGSPEPATLRRFEMRLFQKYLVVLSALGALWLNVSINVNIDISLSSIAVVLILRAIFRR